MRYGPKGKEMKEAGLNAEEIEYAKKDWLLLEAKRIFKENSFDFE